MADMFNLQELEKEARGALNEDGLIYIFIGLLLLAVGASFFLRPLLFLVVFGVLLIYPLEALRRRLTYPRLGYVKFTLPAGTVSGILKFALLIVIFLVAIAVVDNGRYQQILPFAYSVAFTLAFYAGISTQGVQAADVTLIIAMLLVGLAASWRFPDWHDGAAITFLASSLLFIVYGLYALIRFLRKYPVIEKGGDE